MRKERKEPKEQLWPILLVIISFSLGAVFVIAYESGLSPDILGHDLGEIDWSKTIPIIRTDEICLMGNCRTSWPVSTDTRCNTPGRCGQICLGSGCMSSWPVSVPLPPNCGDYSLPKWTGSGWGCVPVDIGAPLYYACPSLSSSCASTFPCRGQYSPVSYCYRSVYVGGFCSGCGCYSTQGVACLPRYS